MKIYRRIYMNLKGAVVPVGVLGEPDPQEYAEKVLKKDGDKMTFLIIPEAELRSLKEGDEGVYVVRYHESVPELGGRIKTVYVDVEKILGEC